MKNQFRKVHKDQTQESLHTLFESVNNFSNTAHMHENKAVLDNLAQTLADMQAQIDALRTDSYTTVFEYGIISRQSTFTA